MTLTERLLEVASTLSQEQLSEVIDFAEYLKMKEKNKVNNLESNEEDPFDDLNFYL